MTRTPLAILMLAAPAPAAVLYLDFDGEPAATWHAYDVPATPAFTGDADAVLAALAEAYERPLVIAADGTAGVRAALDLTITAGPAPQTLFPGRDLKAVVGGDGAWFGGNASGAAWVGSFDSAPLPRTVYVFPGRLGNDPVSAGRIAAHEAGHAFGLDHPDGGYAPGRWMGSPFGGPPAWSEAEYARLVGVLGVAVPEPAKGALLLLLTPLLLRRRRS